jgi:hypothetical protein
MTTNADLQTATAEALRYRIKISLAILAASAFSAVAGQIWPLHRLFDLGMSAGLLLMLAVMVGRWLFRTGASVDPVEVRRDMAARSRLLKTMTGVTLAAGYGLYVVWRYLVPPDLQSVTIGVLVGTLLGLAILIWPALWYGLQAEWRLRQRPKRPFDRSFEMTLSPKRPGRPEEEK